MLPIMIFSKMWILFLLAFMFMKFAFMGKCAHKCAPARNKMSTDPKDEPQKPLFKDKDIVPDGQSGF